MPVGLSLSRIGSKEWSQRPIRFNSPVELSLIGSGAVIAPLETFIHSQNRLDKPRNIAISFEIDPSTVLK